MSEEKVDEFGAAFAELTDENPESKDETTEEVVEETVAETKEETETTAEAGGSEPENTSDADPAADAETSGAEETVDLGALQSERDNLMQYKRSNEGRVSALQRKITELEQQVKTASVQRTSPPENTEVTQEEWAKFEQEYPEIAMAINTRITGMERALQRDVAGQIGQAVQPLQNAEQERYKSNQVAALEAAHPGWVDVVRSEEFNGWLQRQPLAVQQLMESEDASEASYLLDTYKHSQPQKQETETVTQSETPSQESKVDEIKAQREKKLKESQGPASRPTAGATGGIPDDFDAAFKMFANEQQM